MGRAADHGDAGEWQRQTWRGKAGSEAGEADEIGVGRELDGGWVKRR